MKKTTLVYIMIKLLKTSEEEKIFKTSRDKAMLCLEEQK